VCVQGRRISRDTHSCGVDVCQYFPRAVHVRAIAPFSPASPANRKRKRAPQEEAGVDSDLVGHQDDGNEQGGDPNSELEEEAS
jgi:hypothetical protein